MDFGIADKKALVTGAARGIGRAEGQGLGARGGGRGLHHIEARGGGGSRVWGGGGGGPGAGARRQCGARAVACAGDVATPEGARQVVQAALEQLGGLHILVS